MTGGIQTATLVPPSPSRCVSTREGMEAGERYLGTFLGFFQDLELGLFQGLFQDLELVSPPWPLLSHAPRVLHAPPHSSRRGQEPRLANRAAPDSPQP